MDNYNLPERIRQLKEERDVVIMAHYYVNDEVQMVADYIGDSFYLSKMAASVPQKVICMAGVSFMGESARLLNPDKTILLPEPEADCPMAHMADVQKIEAVRRQYEDVAVVCYINSTAELKSHADVCVTSANAEHIVAALTNRNIYFIPDQNLGHYIAQKLPDKNFIYNDGYCHVHADLTVEDVRMVKEKHPGVRMLAHPECRPEILEYADYIGSTSGIIQYAAESADNEFIISTELGVLYELKRRNPDKSFYAVNAGQYCTNMKKITLEKVAVCLENMSPVVELSDALMSRADKALVRMMKLAE